MADTDESPSSSPTTASWSQSCTWTRSVSLIPLSANSADPALPPPSPPNSRYPTIDSPMNTSQPSVGPHTTFSPIQLPGSTHGVTAPTHLPGISPLAAFQNAQPQFGPHLAMWPFLPQQPTSFSPPFPQGHLSPPPQDLSYPTSDAGQSHSAIARHTSPVDSTSRVSSSPPRQEQATDDPEEIAIQEDKRRRNTAASARFRIRKKQKSLNLERTVSDLTGRAEELEREATDLRRENNWLKEIVIMKSRRNMGESEALQGNESSIDFEDSTSEDGSTRGSRNERGKGEGKGAQKEEGKGRGRRKSLSSMSFGRPPSVSSFQVSPPDRGSFPLDHEGECKSKMIAYMSCLRENANNSAQCRQESKEYLECRMSRGLMEREEWKNLGMADIQKVDGTCASCSADVKTSNGSKS